MGHQNLLFHDFSYMKFLLTQPSEALVRSTGKGGWQSKTYLLVGDRAIGMAVKEFFRIFLDFLTSENWMNCRLSWSSWKKMFFSYFSQKLVATRNVSVIIPDRIFLSKKKKKIPGHFCTWRIYWSWSFRGAFNGQKRAPFCFHWSAVEEFYGIFLRLLCVRRAQWKWSAAIDCQRPFWTKNYWLRGGGGWPFIRMKSTWITFHTFILGERNRGKSGGSCLLN